MIATETVGGAVRVIKFNRPDARNALNTEVRKAIDAAFRAAAADDAIRVVVLAGEGENFAAGADIKEQAERDTVDAMLAYTTRAVADCSKPVIAAVNGFALGGGCEMAMQCDFVIASQTAKFGQPEIRLGLIPGAGGTQRLPRLVGRQNALYMLLTATAIDAQAALRMGLVAEVVDGDALPRALELAGKIAKLPPLAAQQIKEVVNAGLDASLDSGLRLERKGYTLMFATADMREGVNAFIEKRRPSFKGR